MRIVQDYPVRQDTWRNCKKDGYKIQWQSEGDENLGRRRLLSQKQYLAKRSQAKFRPRKSCSTDTQHSTGIWWHDHQPPGERVPGRFHTRIIERRRVTGPPPKRWLTENCRGNAREVTRQRSSRRSSYANLGRNRKASYGTMWNTQPKHQQWPRNCGTK